MGANQTLLMVVIYPGIEKYLRDYFSSISKQTYKSFDVLILNDGLDLECLDIASSNILLHMPPGLTPSEIRFEGIKYAIEHSYSHLIFSDADDFFTEDRIELSVLSLTNYNFVYNNIVPVDETGKASADGKDLVNMFPDQISNFEEVLDYNLFGMSNTSISIEGINDIYIPRDIIAVDWWIYTLLLLNGAVGKYVEGPKTYYRQTDDNLVGAKKNLDKKRLVLGIKVKHAHYKDIYKYCKEMKMEEATSIYSNKLDEIIKLKVKIKDNIFLKKYINIVNNNMDQLYKGWWSEIISIKEFNKYENTIN